MNLSEAIAKLAERPYWSQFELPVGFGETLALMQSGKLEVSTFGPDDGYRSWCELDADEQRWVKARREHFSWWVRIGRQVPEQPSGVRGQGRQGCQGKALKPSEKRAYEQFEAACAKAGRELTPDEAYAQVREYADKMPSRDTWLRQLRAGRAAVK